MQQEKKRNHKINAYEEREREREEAEQGVRQFTLCNRSDLTLLRRGALFLVLDYRS